MSKRKRRKRAMRQRRMRKIAAITAAAVLALGIAGLIVWQALERSPGTTAQNYPVAYENLIRIASAQFELDPAYVASVILAESSYVPDAVSSADARGLMQLMPDTAAWIAARLGEPYSEESLFDPAVNIRYGCWYLGFLMERYGGDMRCASSAYHQGQGTVDRWLRDPAYSADGATLDTIPSEATDTYVQRILKYYEKYAKIYEELPA